MRLTDYTDDDGRTWRVRLPDGASDNDAAIGVPVGPPDLSDWAEARGVPARTMVRIHNELHRRAILTRRDAISRLPEIIAALQAAYRVDALAIQAFYAGELAQSERSDTND